MSVLFMFIAFAWAVLLAGCWLISNVLLRIEIYTKLVTGAIRVGIGVFLFILWLIVWRKVAYRYFLKTLKSRKR